MSVRKHTTLERRQAKRIFKRNKVFEEIVSTERTYVDNLRLLCKLYVFPLREAADNKSGAVVLPRETVNELFSNIHLIENLNTRFLTELEELQSNWYVPRSFVHNSYCLFAPIPHSSLFKSEPILPRYTFSSCSPYMYLTVAFPPVWLSTLFSGDPIHLLVMYSFAMLHSSKCTPSTSIIRIVP
jgi:RhoGEF domain